MFIKSMELHLPWVHLYPGTNILRKEPAITATYKNAWYRKLLRLPERVVEYRRMNIIDYWYTLSGKRRKRVNTSTAQLLEDYYFSVSNTNYWNTRENRVYTK